MKYQTYLTYKEERSEIKPTHCFEPPVGKLDGKSGECVLEQTAHLMAKQEVEEEEGPHNSFRSTPPEPTEPP